MKTESEQEVVISKLLECLTSKQMNTSDVKPIYDISEDLPFEFTHKLWNNVCCILSNDNNCNDEMIFSNAKVVHGFFGPKIVNYFKKPCCDNPKHCGEMRVGNCLNCNQVYSEPYNFLVNKVTST
jgi:hypothetical protein